MSELRDRVDTAMRTLFEEDGFSFMEEVPCCEACALHQMAESGVRADDAYCFYHSHDVAIQDVDNSTYLSWGSTEDDARTILRRLQDEGLEASWDGDLSHRIHARLP